MARPSIKLVPMGYGHFTRFDKQQCVRRTVYLDTPLAAIPEEIVPNLRGPMTGPETVDEVRAEFENPTIGAFLLVQ